MRPPRSQSDPAYTCATGSSYKRVGGRSVTGNSRGCAPVLKWNNPRPDQVIQFLDYESAMTDAAPFLLGIMVEKASQGGQ